MIVIENTATLGQKQCPRCQLILPRSAFFRDKTRSDGLQTYCIECRRRHLGYSRRVHACFPIEGEEFRSVPGWEGFYSASNFGRIRRDAGSTLCVRNRLLKPLPDSNGYTSVNLRKNNVPSRCTIHKLVALAFLGYPPEGQIVNHINGIKSDNRIANLEYVTRSGNMQHARRLGLLPTKEQHSERLRQAHAEGKFKHARPGGPRGERAHMAKLTADDVRVIRQRRASGEELKAIAKDYGVTGSNVSCIVNRKSWKHID